MCSLTHLEDTEREQERENEVLHLLVHSPESVNMSAWEMLRTV